MIASSSTGISPSPKFPHLLLKLENHGLESSETKDSKFSPCLPFTRVLKGPIGLETISETLNQEHNEYRRGRPFPVISQIRSPGLGRAPLTLLVTIPSLW